MAGVEVDLFKSNKFNDALRLYVLAQRKELADSINHIAGNVAFRASEFTEPTGTKSAASLRIRASLEGLPITKDNGRKRYGSTRFVGALKLMNWQRKNSGLVPVGNSRNRIVDYKKSFKRDEDGEITGTIYRAIRKKSMGRLTEKGGRKNAFADGKLKKFISRRASAAKFIRIGWAAAAAKFKKPFSRGREGFNDATLQRIGGAQLAKPGPVVEALVINRAGVFDVRFKPKRISGTGTPGRTTSGAIAIGGPALVKAIDFVSKDMMAYVLPRLQRIANRFNAKR